MAAAAPAVFDACEKWPKLCAFLAMGAMGVWVLWMVGVFYFIPRGLINIACWMWEGEGDEAMEWKWIKWWGPNWSWPSWWPEILKKPFPWFVDDVTQCSIKCDNSSYCNNQGEAETTDDFYPDCKCACDTGYSGLKCEILPVTAPSPTPSPTPATSGTPTPATSGPATSGPATPGPVTPPGPPPGPPPVISPGCLPNPSAACKLLPSATYMGGKFHANPGVTVAAATDPCGFYNMTATQCNSTWWEGDIRGDTRSLGKACNWSEGKCVSKATEEWHLSSLCPVESCFAFGPGRANSHAIGGWMEKGMTDARKQTLWDECQPRHGGPPENSVCCGDTCPDSAAGGVPAPPGPSPDIM